MNGTPWAYWVYWATSPVNPVLGWYAGTAGIQWAVTSSRLSWDSEVPAGSEADCARGGQD